MGLVAAALGVALATAPYGGSAHLLAVEDLPELPLEKMTRAQLRTEYNRLEDQRPGIALPIVAIASGGVGVFGGVLTLLYGGLLALALNVPTVVFIVGAVLAVAGGALLAVGIVTLVRAFAERRAFNDEMDHVQQQLDLLDGPPAPEAPPPPTMPPVFVPPPPAAGLLAPPPSLVLARF